MAWSDKEHNLVVDALAVVCQVTGTSLNDDAKRFMLEELCDQPAKEVILALRRCARESTAKLTLGGVLAAMRDEDRKQIADAKASNQAYLTTLRGCALVECIPWDEWHPETVEAALTAKGYKCERMPGYCSKETRKVLPRWTEPKEDEAEPWGA